MLNKITLSIIISFFIIFHNFSSLNAEMNMFKNIEVKSDFPNGINFIVETENNINNSLSIHSPKNSSVLNQNLTILIQLYKITLLQVVIQRKR